MKFEIKEKGKPEYLEKNLAEWGKKPTTAGIEPKSHWCETRLAFLPNTGAHEMEPPSSIQALGAYPFPSRFIIRQFPEETSRANGGKSQSQ